MIPLQPRPRHQHPLGLEDGPVGGALHRNAHRAIGAEAGALGAAHPGHEPGGVQGCLGTEAELQLSLVQGHFGDGQHLGPQLDLEQLEEAKRVRIILGNAAKAVLQVQPVELQILLLAQPRDALVGEKPNQF